MLLGVRSRNLVVGRVAFEALPLAGPAGADELVGGEPAQRLEPLGEVVGHQEGGQVRAELGVVVVVEALDGGFLDRVVHAFDLAVGPGVVGLGEAVLDAVASAGEVEHVGAEAGGVAGAVLGQVGELDGRCR